MISIKIQYNYTISKLLDRSILKKVGLYDLSKIVYNTIRNIAKLNIGNIITYATVRLLGIKYLLFIVIGSEVIIEMVINPDFLNIIFISYYSPSKYKFTSPLLNYNKNLKLLKINYSVQSIYKRSLHTFKPNQKNTNLSILKRI